MVGSDLAGVVLRTGPGVTKWKPGTEVVAHCLSVELEDAEGHDDTMMDPQQRIWGFETNFGGLAELAIVKANQLMPKPTHLPGRRRLAPGLVNSTAYRQLISHNGAHMKLGDRVLIWGASGGLGSYATQMALAGGATPICVVSSPEKAAICRAMGAELIIDRSAEGYRFWNDEGTAQDPKEWQRLGKRIRELTGGHDVDIVFEHPGRETFGASVYVARKGGTIVTCASTSGYMHEYDNRYLWMNLKRIVSSHFANYREAWEANALVDRGLIHPTLSRTYRARGRRPGGPRRAPQRRTRARSACSPSPPRRASGSPTPTSAPGSRARSTASATPEPFVRGRAPPATRVWRGGGDVKVSRLWSPVTRWGDFRRRQLAALEESNRIAARGQDDAAADAASAVDAADRRGCRPRPATGRRPARSPRPRPPPARPRPCRAARVRRPAPDLRRRRAAAQPALAVLHRLLRRHRRAARDRPVEPGRPAHDHADPAHRVDLPGPRAQPPRRRPRRPRHAAIRRPSGSCSPVCWSPSG